MESECFAADSIFKQRIQKTRLRDLAAHPREFYWNVLPPEHQRAQGMPGARRARSLVCSVENTRVQSPLGHAGAPGIPRAMVLTVSFALSPVSEFLLSPSSADEGLSAPGRADFASANLTAATGARTTRLRRPRERRSSACRSIAHGPKPALRFRRSPNAAASTASRALRP